MKKLFRSRTDRQIGGVCGGLGDYLEMDSTIVRLGFFLLTLKGGIGGLAYIAMLFIIPSEAKVETEVKEAE